MSRIILYYFYAWFIIKNTEVSPMVESNDELKKELGRFLKSIRKQKGRQQAK